MGDNSESPTKKLPLSPPDFRRGKPVHDHESDIDEHKHTKWM